MRHRAQGAILALAGIGIAWILLVAVMTERGYAGNQRYLIVTTAALCVLGGIGIGRIFDGIRQAVAGRSSARTGLRVAFAVFAVGLVALSPVIKAKVENVDKTLDKLRYEASLWHTLPGVIDEAGGPTKILACGNIYSGPFQTQMVAYQLGVHGINVGDVRPLRESPGARGDLPHQHRARRAARGRRAPTSASARSAAPGAGGSGPRREPTPAGATARPRAPTHPVSLRPRARPSCRPRADYLSLMASVASRARSLPRPSPSLLTSTPVIVAIVAFLLLISLYMRTRALGASLWMDEGLSIGIASQPFFDIPGVLKQDGAPPLYYMMLHVWMQVFGNGPSETQGLSVAISLIAVPGGLWAGWTLFNRRAGLICAALAAFNPFLTVYAQETRMYSLMVVLSLLTSAAFLHVYVYRNRKYLPLFAVLLAAILYTHSWGIFVTAGIVISLIPPLLATDDRRAFFKDVLIGFTGALILFLPWLPTLIYQAQHTGAPWLNSPRFGAPVQISKSLLGGGTVTVALILAAGSGLAAVLAARGTGTEHGAARVPRPHRGLHGAVDRRGHPCRRVAVLAGHARLDHALPGRRPRPDLPAGLVRPLARGQARAGGAGDHPGHLGRPQDEPTSRTSPTSPTWRPRPTPSSRRATWWSPSSPSSSRWSTTTPSPV